MENIHVNFLAVIAAAVVNMVLGTLWYGKVFGKQWKVLMGFTDESMKSMSMTPVKAIVGGFITAFLMAHVLNYSIIFSSTVMGQVGLKSGLQCSFWNWVGFIVPLTAGAVLWEGKPWKLFFLNASYWLVALLSMGAILSLWR
jgi:hypothetical protein